MSSRKLFVSFLTGALLIAVAGPRVAEASYGFIGQFVGGDITTTGPNQYNAKVNSFNGGTAFGSLAGQAANNVALTGGSEDGVAIGQTTPAAFRGTTVIANGALTNNGAIVKHIVKITTGASYAALASDNIIDVNKTTGSATAITLPASPVDGMEVEVKDKKGDAATNTITVSAASGNIDGQASVSLAIAYGNGVFRYDSVAGTWSLY